MDLLQIKNEQAKTVFMSADFQERWQAYKKAFGKELDDWFGDAYTLKVRVAESLSYLYENRLYEAYAELRHFASVCTTGKDKRMLDKLITLCKNQKEMKKAKVGDWVRNIIVWHCKNRKLCYRAFFALNHTCTLIKRSKVRIKIARIPLS